MAIAVVSVMAVGVALETMKGKLSATGALGRDIEYGVEDLVGARLELQEHATSLSTTAAGLDALDALVARVQALPGVERVALADSLPLAGEPLAPDTMFLTLAPSESTGSGHPRRGAAQYVRAGPGLLETLDMTLLSGRSIRPSDADGAPLVAVISEGAAARLWPGDDALGRQIASPRASLTRVPDEWMTIVGVVANAVTTDDVVLRNTVFVPLAQHRTSTVTILARASREEAFRDGLRRGVAEMSVDVAAQDLGVLEGTAMEWTRAARSALAFTAFLGLVALAMVATSAYGVTAFVVSRRRRECAIRLALGCPRGAVSRLVAKSARISVLVGVLCGVAIASIASRYVEAAAFAPVPNSLTTWISVTTVAYLIGAVAAYLPARRASRVHPATALDIQ
jgi:hypothetical protein